MRNGSIIAVGIAAALWTGQARAQDAAPAATDVTAAQLFDLADAARDRGEWATAERAYRALAANPDQELRTEARFRLALMLADRMERRRDGAALLRRILDEKPGAQGVRLELARIQAQLGNFAAAAREVRAARAAGPLPADVDQLVRFFANALDASKRAGASLEVALAPDTNINRATRSETLGTVIGELELDRDARERSGVGLSLRGQTYRRVPLGRTTDLLLRASADADLYADRRFDDIFAAVQAGPQLRSGRDRVSVAATLGHRWFGLKPYALSYGLTANWSHPLGPRAQLRVDGGAVREDNRVSPLRDLSRYSLSATLERAFTPRFGGGLSLSGVREAARDPSVSLAAGGVTAFLFRELGRTTAVATLGWSHLQADARAFLYPDRRRDDRLSASLQGTFRALSVGSFAPFARARVERNRSTIGIYDYRRIAAEFGVTAAF